jgi:hypothetical protein
LARPANEANAINVSSQRFMEGIAKRRYFEAGKEIVPEKAIDAKQPPADARFHFTFHFISLVSFQEGCVEMIQ